MAWLVERKATDEDKDALEKAARRFADRHEIAIDLNESFTSQVENELAYRLDGYYPADWERTYWKQIKRLWLGCVRRALHSKDAEGIAWDTVGCSE